MRLQKYLALCGVASRRKCEEIILEGRVCVDGAAVTELGTQVEKGQRVTLDGAEVTPEARKRYILYHKPAGEVTTVSDDKGRETVLRRFAGEIPERIYPVGRLDYDSEGLLLLTNDGPLAHRLLSPRRHVDKTYFVRADRPFDGADEAAFAAGMVLRDGLHCLPARLERLDCPEEALVTIQEGKYHQIKRMVASQYKQVVYLKRLSMGALKLDPALEKGAWRYLTPAECAALRDAGD